MTIKISISTIIAQKQVDVWDFITDFDNAPTWMPGITRIEQLDEGDLARGSMLRVERHGSTYQLKLSYWELGKCFTLTQEQNGTSTDTSYRLEPLDDKTELRLDIVIDVTGIRLLWAPFKAWLIERQARQSSQQLKQLLENK